mmetsp:Transcript_6189/g.12177  ORF Transcript_6189/g.12177 Transcript_6189/m.12177 type:complete len:126 (-) Transcript_6189:1597-1974(-)|eukprot:6201122-Pleurochrysis_carterae.AAC.5
MISESSHLRSAIHCTIRKTERAAAFTRGISRILSMQNKSRGPMRELDDLQQTLMPNGEAGADVGQSAKPAIETEEQEEPFRGAPLRHVERQLQRVAKHVSDKQPRDRRVEYVPTVRSCLSPRRLT